MPEREQDLELLELPHLPVVPPLAAGAEEVGPRPLRSRRCLEPDPDHPLADPLEHVLEGGARSTTEAFGFNDPLPLDVLTQASGFPDIGKRMREVPCIHDLDIRKKIVDTFPDIPEMAPARQSIIDASPLVERSNPNDLVVDVGGGSSEVAVGTMDGGVRMAWMGRSIESSTGDGNTPSTMTDTIAARSLVAYHLEHQRPMMGAFLDALGISHEDGLISEDNVTVPEAEKVQTAAADLAEKYPADDVALYFSTLVSQDPETWTALIDLPQTQGPQSTAG